MKFIENPHELARAYMVDNNMDYASLNNGYSTGVSPANKEFARQFTQACIEDIVFSVKPSFNPLKTLNDKMTPFSQAILAFNDTEFSRALFDLKLTLVAQFPKFSERGNLKKEVINLISNSIKKNQNTSANKDELVDSISTSVTKKHTI